MLRSSDLLANLRSSNLPELRSSTAGEPTHVELAGATLVGLAGKPTLVGLAGAMLVGLAGEPTPVELAGAMLVKLAGEPPLAELLMMALGPGPHLAMNRQRSKASSPVSSTLG